MSFQLDSARDQHMRQGWVLTVHGSQSATAERSMVRLESFRTNTVDARSVYVAISRGKIEASVYTDSREKLAGAIEQRTVERSIALASGRSPASEKGSKTPSAKSMG